MNIITTFIDECESLLMHQLSWIIFVAEKDYLWVHCATSRSHARKACDPLLEPGIFCALHAQSYIGGVLRRLTQTKYNEDNQQRCSEQRKQFCVLAPLSTGLNSHTCLRFHLFTDPSNGSQTCPSSDPNTNKKLKLHRKRRLHQKDNSTSTSTHRDPTTSEKAGTHPSRTITALHHHRLAPPSLQRRSQWFQIHKHTLWAGRCRRM